MDKKVNVCNVNLSMAAMSIRKKIMPL